MGHWRATWSTVCSSAPHSQAAEKVIPHLCKAGAETSDTGAEAVKPTLFVAGSYCNHCYPFVTNRTFNANGEVVTARKLVIVINQQQCLLHLATTYKHSNRQIFWIIYCLSDNLGTPLCTTLKWVTTNWDWEEKNQFFLVPCSFNLVRKYICLPFQHFLERWATQPWVFRIVLPYHAQRFQLSENVDTTYGNH